MGKQAVEIESLTNKRKKERKQIKNVSKYILKSKIKSFTSIGSGFYVSVTFSHLFLKLLTVIHKKIGDI